MPIISPLRRIASIFAFALVLLGAASGDATPVATGAGACHAVTRDTIADAAVRRVRFSCAGTATDYQRASLWIRADPSAIVRQGDGVVVLIGQTRFDRLSAFFNYRDGRTIRVGVRRGDFGDHWRVGAQIVFVAPHGGAMLDNVVLRFDHLASLKLVHARLMPVSRAGRDMTITSALIGGALSLLLLGGLYNISLAGAVRRQFLAWHAAWAGTVFVWGMFWSQFALLIAPGLAGTQASQICTFLACLAVVLATVSGVTALDPREVPAPLRWVTIGIALLLLALAVPATLVVGAALDLVGTFLSLVLLADLLAMSACVGIAWRAGNVEARDLAYAWAVPMLTLGITEFVDIGDSLFGGGSQIAVLFASALQIVWLSIATTIRLARLRIERDAARAAESEMGELASRDPLTGLLNRRGFIDRTHQLFGGPEQKEVEFALLLIDIDHFKSINDNFGHEVGDEVLCRIAGRLRLWERELCIAGRLGGEEFVLGVSGLSAFALGQFADQLRVDLGACNHGKVTERRRVTVSIGVAAGRAAATFQKLYGLADRALYEAKRAGRDRVSFHGVDEEWLAALTRDQLSFELQPRRS